VRVRVHRNLHKAAWSVVDPKTGRVIAHVDRIALKDVEFRVQEGGRQTVLRTRQRSVHAYVVGELVGTIQKPPSRPSGLRRFSYDPYRAATFTRASDGAPVYASTTVHFDEEGAWCA